MSCGPVVVHNENAPVGADNLCIDPSNILVSANLTSFGSENILSGSLLDLDSSVSLETGS